MGICAKKLSDSELLAALDELTDRHRELVATLVEHLAEVERRQLHLRLGYSSLYVYATERLGLSEHEAYLRITAARVAQRHDEVIPALESGALSLSTVKVVAPHLAAHPELLAEAAGQSKRQVDRVVAERVGGDSVRSGWKTRPLKGGRVELTCVVSEETAGLLGEALDLMMHENPERDCEQVLARALCLLVAEKKKPRCRVPAQAQRAVTAERRCSFVGDGGRVCGETRFLELNHVVPKAAGGSDEPDNLRWLCRAHNQYEARRQLGPDLVERGKIRARLERDAHSALVNLGFAKAEAAQAARRGVHEAREFDVTLVVRAALASLWPNRAWGARPQRRVA